MQDFLICTADNLFVTASGSFSFQIIFYLLPAFLIRGNFYSFKFPAVLTRWVFPWFDFRLCMFCSFPRRLAFQFSFRFCFCWRLALYSVIIPIICIVFSPSTNSCSRLGLMKTSVRTGVDSAPVLTSTMQKWCI